jgi:microcystin-dependent protein
MPSHNHNNALVGQTTALAGMVNDPRYHNSGHFKQMDSAGGDQPHNNMQPFVVLNYIIKV